MGKKERRKMSALAEFIQANKSKIKRISESNSSKKSNGVPVITTNDKWREETEWDAHYQELDKNK